MAFPFLPKLAEAHAFAQDPGNTASKYYLRNRLQIDLLLTTSLLLNTVHTTFYVILCPHICGFDQLQGTSSDVQLSFDLQDTGLLESLLFLQMLWGASPFVSLD
ncbi:hypothetical protein JHK87_026245 [Glycine soja]|nr:hypothetical protein JHK87_026245 [Glycine soja]